MPSGIEPLSTISTESTTAATKAPPKATGRPGKTTGRDVIRSCSLAKVTTEPANEIEPTTIVNAVATRKKPGTEPVSMCSSSSRATSAAAPPPTPLNSATICGIWVIWTLLAPMTPPSEPIATAIRIGDDVVEPST